MNQVRLRHFPIRTLTFSSPPSLFVSIRSNYEACGVYLKFSEALDAIEDELDRLMVCIWVVRRGKADAALLIYLAFLPSSSERF